MLARFKEVCETVLKYKDYRDKDVREAVVSLLSQLAKFCPEAFIRGYLDQCLGHLIMTLKNGNTKRGAAYLALGNMALVPISLSASAGLELPSLLLSHVAVYL